MTDPAEALEDGPAPPRPVDPKPRRSRLLLRLVALGAVALVVGAAIGALWVKAFFPDLVRAEITRRADAMGLDLTFSRFEARGLLPWENVPEVVVLEDVEVTVRSAPDARIRATRAIVELSHHAPERVELVELVVAADHVQGLVDLMKAGQTEPLSAVPLEATSARVTIGALAEAIPVPVDVRVGHVDAHEGTLELVDLTAEPALPFVELEPLPITLVRKASSSVVTSTALPGVTIELDDAAKHAELALASVNPRSLSTLLHAKLPSMTVTGTIDVDLTRTLAPEATFDLHLIGFVPPHPPELGGIVFGKETRATGTARLSGKRLLMPTLALKAGSLALKGSGDADPLGTGTLSLSLAGSIGCAELAASAAGAHFGWEGSVLTSTLARGRLTGTVGVTVEVRARIDDLEHAKATPSAVIRCGVKLP